MESPFLDKRTITPNWRTDANALLIRSDETPHIMGKSCKTGCFEGLKAQVEKIPPEKRIKRIQLTRSDNSIELRRGLKNTPRVVLVSKPLFAVHSTPPALPNENPPLLPPGSGNCSKPHSQSSESWVNDRGDDDEEVLEVPRAATLRKIDEVMQCLQISQEKSKELMRALEECEAEPVQERLLAYPEALSFYAAPKNRYGDVLPKGLDLVRLKFRALPFTDYINANYFRGMIITQGPLKNTLVDFWIMVWEQGRHVLCLTEHQSLNRSKELIEKTYPYWNPSLASPHPNHPGPLEKGIIFDEVIGIEGLRKRLTVRLLGPPQPDTVKHSEYFTRQDFELTFGESSKTVTHWFFHHWKDHGDCREQVLVSLLEQLLPLPGLSIIHCSAGIGRAGTFAVIKSLLDEYLKSKSIPGEDEILDSIAELRKRRPGSVQTKQQLSLIFSTVSLFIRRNLSRV